MDTDPSSTVPDACMRDADGHLRLVGSACRECGTLVFPVTTVCSHCMSEWLERRPLAPGGVLYTSTTMHVGPREWTKPYAVGYVDLADGVRVFGHLTGRKANIGDPMRLETATIGYTLEGRPLTTFAFAPVEAAA